MLIDTHCHLTYTGLSENEEAVLFRAAAAGVTRAITIGTHLEDHPKALATARRQAGVFVALGVHPHHAAETPPGFEKEMERVLASEPKAVGVGECGLDYHYDFSPRPVQRAAFLVQLEVARRLKLPVVLHVREAHADALAILQDFSDLPLVVHCFTGNPAECRAWLDRGAYLGITGIVTYKNAHDVRQAATMVPADRLLLETDAPYLSPEPVRKNKTNEPANVFHIARFIAPLRGLSLEQLAQQTTTNAARLFGQKLVTSEIRNL